MSEPLKLFISYRSSDASKVDKIAQDLALLRDEHNKPRYAPWQDKRNLPPASPHWWDAIVEAIDECPVFVFHISQGSLASVVCMAELDYAHRRNRPIIPIVLEGEFLLDSVSGKYDLPKDTWTRVPIWLGERQFLFYTGADFFGQFERAMDVFRRSWPLETYARPPMQPDPNGAKISSHTLYDQACDYAERLAFAEAETRFDVLVRRKDRGFGAVAAEWLELLRRYAELVEIDALPRARFRFKPLWEEYIALFPKEFWEGLFDPKGFASKITAQGPSTPPLPPVTTPPVERAITAPESAASPPVTTPPKAMTAEEYFERAGSQWLKNRHDQAIADYTEAIRLNPNYIGAYIERGNCYHQKKDYVRAIADYTEAIRLNPQFANAYNNRGIIYHANKDYDRAIADYDTALRLNPNHAAAKIGREKASQERTASLTPHVTVEEYFERADEHRKNGRYDQAIADYTEAIRLDSQFGKTYNYRGIIYHTIKDYDRAVADFTEAIRLNPRYADAYNNRGYCYHTIKDYDRAIADYTEAIRLNPHDVNVYYNRGLSYNENKDYDRAIADFTEVIRFNPRYTDAYANRGYSYNLKKDYDQAIADCDAALRLNGEHFFAAVNREKAIQARAASIKSVPSAETLFSSADMTAEQYFKRAKDHQRKGRFDEAIADYTEAIRLNPEYTDAYVDRGESYQNKGDYDQAIVDYEAVLRLNPGNWIAEVGLESAYQARTTNTKHASPVETPPPATDMIAEQYFKRAEDYRRKERYDQAIADFNEAIRLNPHYASAYFYRGRSYSAMSNHDSAIADYTEAIHLNPQHADAYYLRGFIYYQKKDYDRAIADFDATLRIKPNHTSAQANRKIAMKEQPANKNTAPGLTTKQYFEGAEDHRRNGFYDQAIVDYTEAIRLNPQYADAYNNRGLSYYAKKEYDRAIADYTEAIRLNPQYADAYTNRGNNYYAKKEYDLAIDDYDAALSIKPNDSYAKGKRKLTLEAQQKSKRRWFGR